MEDVLNVAPRPKSTRANLLLYLKERFGLLLHRGNKIAYLRDLGVKIGQGCQIITSVNAFGTEPYLIELGNRVTITSGVVFLTHDGASRLFRHRVAGSSPYGNRFGRILIHDECFIGVNSVIMPDVEIGPNSIIGAGSLVNKDVPPNMVYAGVPAKPICTLDEYIERYRQKMIDIRAKDRQSLRKELTKRFWGEER